MNLQLLLRTVKRRIISKTGKQGGLYREIVERLGAYGAVIAPEDTDSPSIHTSFIKKYHRHVTPFDSFMLQVVLDEMTEEAGAPGLL